MKNVRTAAVVTALLAGGGTAVFGMASPAVAYYSPPLFLDVSVQSPAQLVARGAAVQVPVIATCSSPTAWVSVQVTERIGKSVASGGGGTSIGCTGGHETVLITVSASPSGKAFAKGSAYATATISGCADTVCGSENASQTIRIR